MRTVRGSGHLGGGDGPQHAMGQTPPVTEWFNPDISIPSVLKINNGGFHKLDEIFNNANIGIRGLTMWKQKNPVTKCYP